MNRYDMTSPDTGEHRVITIIGLALIVILTGAVLVAPSLLGAIGYA